MFARDSFNFASLSFAENRTKMRRNLHGRAVYIIVDAAPEIDCACVPRRENRRAELNDGRRDGTETGFPLRRRDVSGVERPTRFAIHATIRVYDTTRRDGLRANPVRRMRQWATGRMATVEPPVALSVEKKRRYCGERVGSETYVIRTRSARPRRFVFELKKNCPRYERIRVAAIPRL